MENLEKAIEKDAEAHGNSYDDIYGTRTVAIDSFESGAKSEAAKEFHQQGMYTEENLKTAWSQGYNKAVSSINEDRFDEDDNAPTFDQWLIKLKNHE